MGGGRLRRFFHIFFAPLLDCNPIINSQNSFSIYHGIFPEEQPLKLIVVYFPFFAADFWLKSAVAFEYQKIWISRVVFRPQPTR